jgi:hypothetical protein
MKEAFLKNPALQKKVFLKEELSQSAIGISTQFAIFGK